MKKEFKEAEIEVISLQMTDIITNSICDDDDLPCATFNSQTGPCGGTDSNN